MNRNDSAVALAASTVRRLGLDMDVPLNVRSERIVLFEKLLRTLETRISRERGVG